MIEAGKYRGMDVAQASATNTATTRIHSLLLALLLVLSAYLQFTVVARSEVVSPIRADAAVYFSYAYNLKHYGIYSSELTWASPKTERAPVPDSLTTPGYPLFLLAVPGLDLNQTYVDRVLFAQAALGSLCVWLTVLVARNFLAPSWALAAGALVALSPHLLSVSTYLLTEPLFLSFLLGSVLASIRAAKSQRGVDFLLAGACWGACGLVRSTTQFLPLLFALAAVLIPRLRRWRRPAIIMLLAFLVIQSPWIIRNLGVPRVEGQPNLAISFLHHGSYPGFMYEDRPETFGFPYRFDPNDAAAAKSIPAVLADIAGKFRERPLEYARWYLIGKPIMFLSWSNLPGIGDIYIYPMRHSPFVESPEFWLLRALALTLHWPLTILGLIGAISVWLVPGRLGVSGQSLLASRIVSLVLLYAIGLHMVGAPFPRYGIPFRPLVYMLALSVLAALAGRRNRTQVEAA